MNDLENKIGKPDWKQYVPVYGIYRAISDDKKGLPSIVQSEGVQIMSAAYHGTIIGGAILSLVEYLN